MAGSTPRLPRAGRKETLLGLAPALAPVLALFVGGVGVSLGQSLGFWLPSPSPLGGAPAYAALLEPHVARSFLLSVWVGGVSAGASVALGMLLAHGLWRLGAATEPWAGAWRLPLIVPPVAAGFLALLWLGQSGLLSSLAHAAGLVATPAEFPALFHTGWGLGIIAAYVWKETPFVTLLCLASLRRLDPRLLQAARMLGAGPWRTFRRVTLPHCLPALGTAWVILFCFGFGAYDLPALLGESDPGMLSVEAHNLALERDAASRPLAMAMLTAMFFFSMLCIALHARLRRRLGSRDRVW